MATDKKRKESKQNIDNRNYESAQSDSRESIRSAAAYNPGFQKFTQMTGVEDKAKVVAESADTKANGSTGKHAFSRETASARFKKKQEAKKSGQ